MGGVSRFSVKSFLSHSAKKFRREESFSVSIISGIEKLHVAEAYVTVSDFLSKFFCVTVPKKLVGEPFCAVFQQKFMDKRGGVSSFSVENFLTHIAENFRRWGRGGNTIVFQ